MTLRDWLWSGVALILLGVYALVIPVGRAVSLGERMLPILLFLATITIVVNLSAKAGVFAHAAQFAARAAGGRPMLLWLLVTSLALVCTAFLSLDTTAVLVTPLAISLVWAVRADIVPYALIVVWIANIGSLWLPVSNLTNLLSVQSRIMAGTSEYLGETLWPSALGVGVTIGFTGVIYRRRLSRGRHRPVPAVAAGPESPVPLHPPPRHRALLPCTLTLMIALPLLATPVPYWLTSSAAAVVLGVVFLRIDRSPLRPSLLPWGAMGLALTLVAAVDLLHAGGAEVFVQRALSTDGEASGLVLLTAGGVVASNVLNNLPAYLLLEPAATTAPEVAALLIGVNAGPLLTPWASLATLLWADQLRRAGITVPWTSFTVLGCVLVPLVCAVMLFPLLIQAA